MAWTMDFSNMFGRERDDEETSNIATSAGGTLLGELPPPPPDNPDNPIEYEYTEPTNVPGEPPPGPTDVSGAGQPSGLAPDVSSPTGGLLPGGPTETPTWNLPPPTWMQPPGIGTGFGEDIRPGGPTGKELPDKFDLPPQAQPPGAAEDYPWTYEQQWIDPYIRGIQARDQSAQQRLLGDIATGQVVSPAIQQQRERAQQAALATAASARGVPTSAVMRNLSQQMSEADRASMEAASKQQLEVTSLIAQIEGQRDTMIANLVGQGVDRNVAQLQVAAELEKQKKDLEYKYFAGKLGATTEVLKAGMEHAAFGEHGSENVAEEARIMNLIMGAMTPAGYDVPFQRIVGTQVEDPEAEFFVQQFGGSGGQGAGQLIWDEATSQWRRVGDAAGAIGGYQNLGIMDVMGQRMQAYRMWNPEDNRYDYGYMPLAGPDYTQLLTGAGATGQGLPSAPPGLSPEEYVEFWEQQYGATGQTQGGQVPVYDDQGNIIDWQDPPPPPPPQTTYAGMGDPPEYGDPPSYNYEVGGPGDPMGMDPSRFIQGLTPTADQFKLRSGISPNAMFQRSGAPQGPMGFSPGELQLNMPRSGITDPISAPGAGLPNQGKLRLGELKPGLQPTLSPGQLMPEKSNWRKYAKTGLKLGEGALDVGIQGTRLLGAKGQKAQEKALLKTGMYAGGKLLGLGFDALEDYLGDAPEAAEVAKEGAKEIFGGLSGVSDEATSGALAAEGGELAKKAGEAAFGETAKELVSQAGEEVAAAAGEKAIEAGAENIAGSVAPGVGTALTAAKDIITGFGDKNPLGGLAKGVGAAGGAMAGATAGLAAGPGAVVASPVLAMLGAFGGRQLGGKVAGLTEKARLTQPYKVVADPGSTYLPSYTEMGDPRKGEMVARLLRGYGRKA